MAKEKQQNPGKGDKPAKQPRQPKADKGAGGGKGGKKVDLKMPKSPPRMRVMFDETVRPKVREEFGIGNIHECPRPVKVTINMGIGDAHDNKNLLEKLKGHMTQLSGQAALTTYARRSIAGFKLREGWACGVKVTLRKARMWYFLDKLISLAIPRVRDFRGVNPDAFDKAGNYSLGLTEQGLFPEINMDKV
jgi:large subunit ribosomal protein L5